METMNLKLTNHAFGRISKRFGLKSKDAAEKLANKIILEGKRVPMTNGLITFVHNGHSFVFSETKNQFGQTILLMITACNDDKSSEWTSYSKGRVIKKSSQKLSKLQRAGRGAKKIKELEVDFEDYWEDAS